MWKPLISCFIAGVRDQWQDSPTGEQIEKKNKYNAPGMETVFGMNDQFLRVFAAKIHNCS